jgi:predicted metal-dependent phosphoesterase TrpH
MPVGEEAFDFHIHTRASDGFLPPPEVVGRASKAGLHGISITDHDTIDAYREVDAAVDAAPRALRLLPGVEISARLAEREVHILGYFPSGFPDSFAAYIDQVLEWRRRRIADGIVRLRERGIDITWKDCELVASGRVVSKSHMARVLMAKRYVARAHRAHAVFLSEGTVPLPQPTAEDVVSTIRAEGGIGVWAHPSVRDVVEHLPRLAQAGIDGVEVYLPRRRPAHRSEIARRAQAAGLLLTGGSDWHGGEGTPDLGDFRLRREQASEFLARVGWT